MVLMSKEELELIRTIIPWVIGHEHIGNKNKPILKPDAPQEIVEKRDKLWEIVLAEVIDFNDPHQ